MLTYTELKKAEKIALHASRYAGGSPHAIVIKAERESWHDFSGVTWKVVLHTPSLPESQIIIGGICADMRAAQ